MDALLIKVLRLLVPVAQKVLTPSQTKPPKPNTTTYIPSPFVPGKITRKTQRRRLKTEIYTPSSEPHDTALPVIINLHGSGFCLPNLGEDAAFCAYLARSLPAIVLDVDYSHAPDHPWPAAVEDVDSAIMFVRHFAAEGKKQRKRHGAIGATGQKEWLWDQDRIAVTGFSSGGNLALIAGTRSANHGGVQAVVAFYPSTNLAEDAYDKPQLRPLKGSAGSVLPPWLRKSLYNCYVPMNVVKDRKQPYISPLYADPAAFVPSVTVLTAEQDSLAREGSQLVERLQSSDAFKGTLVHWEAKGQGHNWDKMTKKGTAPAKMKDEAYAMVAKRLREAFSATDSLTEQNLDDEHDENINGEAQANVVEAKAQTRNSTVLESKALPPLPSTEQ